MELITARAKKLLLFLFAALFYYFAKFARHSTASSLSPRFFRAFWDKVRHLVGPWPPRTETVTQHGPYLLGGLFFLTATSYFRELRAADSADEYLLHERQERRNSCREIVRVCVLRHRLLHLCFGGTARKASKTSKGDHAGFAGTSKRTRTAPENDSSRSKTESETIRYYLLALHRWSTASATAIGVEHNNGAAPDAVRNDSNAASEGLLLADLEKLFAPPSAASAQQHDGSAPGIISLLAQSRSGAQETSLSSTSLQSNQLADYPESVHRQEQRDEISNTKTSPNLHGSPTTASVASLDEHRRPSLESGGGGGSATSLVSLPMTAEDAFRSVEALGKCAPRDPMLVCGALVVACLLKLELRMLLDKVQNKQDENLATTADEDAAQKQVPLSCTPSATSFF
ncbi:unnamed protein product, partial [Amoebophrya sp. A120]|eukprot:GSA120T00003711001.1